MLEKIPQENNKPSIFEKTAKAVALAVPLLFNAPAEAGQATEASFVSAYQKVSTYIGSLPSINPIGESKYSLGKDIKDLRPAIENYLETGNREVFGKAGPELQRVLSTYDALFSDADQQTRQKLAGKLKTLVEAIAEDKPVEEIMAKIQSLKKPLQ